MLSYGRLAAGKGRHAYIPIKMASGVQDKTCVFVEVAGSYEKNFNLTVSWDGVYSALQVGCPCAKLKWH